MSSPFPPGFPVDRSNPYAAPEAEIGPGHDAGFGLSPTPFTVGDVMARTWQIYKGKMWNCNGVVLFSLAINLGGQFLIGLLDRLIPLGMDARVLPAVVMIATVGLVLFSIWIGIGQALFLLRIARGENAAFGDIFRGGRFLLPILLASIAYGLALTLVIVLGAIPGGMVMAVTGGNMAVGLIGFGLSLLVAVIAGMILSLRLSQFHYLIIDRGAGIMESLRLSLQVTRGNAGNILVIWVMTGLVNLAGALACGVGLLFTFPFATLVFAVTYLALTGQPIADPLAPGKPANDPRLLGPDGPVSDTF